MARMIAPNGVVVAVADGRVAALETVGFRNVKRKPGRPRKAVALPAPRPEEADEK